MRELIDNVATTEEDLVIDNLEGMSEDVMIDDGVEEGFEGLEDFNELEGEGIDGFEGSEDFEDLEDFEYNDEFGDMGEGYYEEGYDMGMGMDMDEPKDPLLSSWGFVIGITVAVLLVGVAVGALLARLKIKKGIELYED